MKKERTQLVLQSNLDKREAISSYLSSIAVSFIADADARSVPSFSKFLIF